MRPTRFGRVVTAVAILAGVGVAVPAPVRAADPQCPSHVGEAQVAPPSDDIGAIEEPRSANESWRLACRYLIDGELAAAVTVQWYEPGQKHRDCPLVKETESPSDGAFNHDNRAISAYYSIVQSSDPRYPPLATARGAASEIVAAVAPRGASCATTKTCVITGRVTDPAGDPVAGVHMALRGNGLAADVATKSDGTYDFRDYATPDFDPETDFVTVHLFLEEQGVFTVRHGDAVAERATAPFDVGGRARCRRDFTAGTDYAASVPQSADDWVGLWTIFERLRDAVTFTRDHLGQQLDYLPVTMHAFCSASKPYCTDQEAFYYSDTTAQTGYSPTIVLSTRVSLNARLPFSDTVAHEFGHHVMSDSFSNQPPSSPGSQNHAGYYANPSSTDSFAEGTASWFAAMVAKHGAGDLAPPRYRWENGSALEFETDIKAWNRDGLHEEWAVAGLLLDFEDGTKDYPDPGQMELPEGAVTTKVLTTPKGVRIIVGKLLSLRPEQDALVNLALVREGKPVRTVPMWVQGNDRTFRHQSSQLFFAIAPRGVVFDRVRVTGRYVTARDDDPIDVELAELWRTITRGSTGDEKVGKPVGYPHPFDVHELYQVLAAAYGGADSDGDGQDDVDQIFVSHGFFDDLNGDQARGANERIGFSGHPSAPGKTTDGTSRTEPDFPAEQLAHVASGDVDASYVVFVTYPESAAVSNSAYAVMPDDDGKIPLAMPAADSGASVTVLALAAGHLPAVVATIEAADFARDARAHRGESFLSYDVALSKGAVTLGGGGGNRRLVLAGVGAVAIGIGLLLAASRRRGT